MSQWCVIMKILGFLTYQSSQEGEFDGLLAELLEIYPVFLIRFKMKEDDNFDEMERVVYQYVIYVNVIVDVG